jgi:hypothetical protein
MATKKKTFDPAQAANEKVLAEREARIEAKRRPLPDLGLEIAQNEPASAAEFLADAFDKRTFGPPAETISKVVYGPDPLLDQCPGMKAAIEKIGLHDYAEATRRAILNKGAMAVGDGVLRQGLHAAISKFGAEKVADAFADRILKIPCRTIEYELDRDVDIEIAGGRVLDETVARYKEPGMSYKFLSDRVTNVLGTRGYETVKDARGDVVKVGTLMLAKIPQMLAEKRRAYYERQSQEAIQGEVEKFEEEAERLAHQSGHRGVGPLKANEVMTANATESEDYLGQSRPAGFSIEEVSVVNE